MAKRRPPFIVTVATAGLFASTGITQGCFLSTTNPPAPVDTGDTGDTGAGSDTGSGGDTGDTGDTPNG